MWLEANPTRKDSEIAYRNDLRMLRAHGVPFKEVTIPWLELRRKYGIEVRLTYEGGKKLIDEIKRAKEEAGITNEWHLLFDLFTLDGKQRNYLYIPSNISTAYLGSLKHFAYCGCPSCQECLEHPDRWSSHPFPSI